MKNKRSTGFWILVSIGILLNILYLMGQTMAVISYDFAESIGLQEPLKEITAVGVALNKGFGLGDTLVYMPLFITGILGLIKRRTWGYNSMLAALGITVYWPVVSLATVFFAKGAEGWNFNDYKSYSFLLGFIALYGLWGFIYLCKNRINLVLKSNNKKEFNN